MTAPVLTRYERRSLQRGKELQHASALVERQLFKRSSLRQRLPRVSQYGITNRGETPVMEELRATADVPQAPRQESTISLSKHGRSRRLIQVQWFLHRGVSAVRDVVQLEVGKGGHPHDVTGGNQARMRKAAGSEVNSQHSSRDLECAGLVVWSRFGIGPP